MSRKRSLGKPVKTAFHQESIGTLRAATEAATARSKARQRRPVEHAVKHQARARIKAVKHVIAQLGT